MHPLLHVDHIDIPVEDYLAEIGEVFATIRGHDSGNTSYGVAVGEQRWFVKHADQPEAVSILESAVRFHSAVQHSAIIPLTGFFRTPTGLAVVHPWQDGEVLNDPRAPGAVPREDGGSTYARFRALPLDQLLAALGAIFDAHLEVARRGFVPVDFYDGSVIYDFDRRAIHLCDLDLYCPGPYRLDRDRQYGSTRFMAPEEFERGALIDERTTVFTLGRTAFVFLSRGEQGETDFERWRGERAQYEVALHAVAPSREDRYPAVAAFVHAWRKAIGVTA
jgi:serine/threonine-protein kinase